MKIAEARQKTGFEKCDFESYSDKCESCGSELNRHNSENYIRTCHEHDEGDYACNKCVITHAKTMHLQYVY